MKPTLDQITDESVRMGRMLATNASGDEIVISGIAAHLPESDNIDHFTENLTKNIYLVTNDDRRWVRSYEDTPYSCGKINFHDKVDAGFFDISYQEADFMDPQCRHLIERAVEAVMDAGYSLAELQKTRTGVYAASTLSDSEKILLFDKLHSPHFGLKGCTHSLLAHHISFHLGLTGPSGNMDSACSSGMYCFEEAYRNILMGKIDNAIIAGAHVVLNPILNQFFYKLGIVSLDGDTMVFDGNGYIRSEAAVVLFLQRAKDARRVYAEVVHVKVNVDGFKEEGLTFPSQYMISQLMEETLIECNTDPRDLVVMEAHATGTRTGDPQELYAITQSLSKMRTNPLLLGSVKSAIGHTEPVSGICSLLKIVLGMNNDIIYPNCNFHDQNDLEESMLKRNLKIMTKMTEWPKDSTNLACVTSYGFGGANSFIIVKRWSKEKARLGAPIDDLPRLICFSGRNERCLEPIVQKVNGRSLDEEYVRLLHSVFGYSIRNHHARGFVIQSKSGVVKTCTEQVEKSPLCFAFENLNDNWTDVYKQLNKIVLFKNIAEKIGGVADMQNKIVGNVVIQAALIETLREIGAESKYVVGKNLGVLLAAYADGALSLEQLLASAQRVDHHLANGKSSNWDALSQDKAFKQALTKDLQKIIAKPKKVSDKWILRSSDGLMSAENIVKYLVGEVGLEKKLEPIALVSFGETSFKFDANLVTNMLSEVNGHNVFEYFLTSLGRIYQSGHNLKLEKLYPEVSFPVSRKTPSISPIIGWAHDEDWYLFRHTNTPADSVQTFDFALKGQDPDWIFLSGHVLDGQCLTPMSAFVYMVWDTFSRMIGVMKVKMQVTFENVKMHKIINILHEHHKKFVVRILKHTGRFEIEELGEPIFSGTITFGCSEFDDVVRMVPEGVVLSEEDVYKKFRLRGYNYNDLFRGIKRYDVSNREALIEWNKNWTAFLDNMMQLRILQSADNRLEFPVAFEKLTIDALIFLQRADNLKRAVCCENIIRSEGIELQNIMTKSLKRQKTTSKTVVQSYKFIPYHTELPLNNALQVNTQVIVENVPSKKIKIVEVVDNFTSNRMQILSPTMQEAASNYAATQMDMTILSDAPMDVEGASVIQRSLSDKESCDLLIMSDIFKKGRFDSALNALGQHGFILAREDSSIDIDQASREFLNQVCVVSNYNCKHERLVLMKKSSPYSVPPAIKILNRNFEWVPQLQQALKAKQKVLLLAENDPTNGVVGFVNSLRAEPGNFDKIRCLFVSENNKQFQPSNNFIYDQLKKDVCMNVLRDGVWGSYRNVTMASPKMVARRNVELDNNFVWYDGAERAAAEFQKLNVLVNYASVLVKKKSSMADVDCVLPMVDFAGTDESGKRVMGYANHVLLSSEVQADRFLTWDVPNNWDLKEAVTVPQSYLSAVYLLIVMGNLKRGSTVLVHSVDPSTVEAIVNVTNHYDCHLFVTDQNRETLTHLTNRYKNASKIFVDNFNNVLFKKQLRKRNGAQIIINSSTTKNLSSLTNCLARNGTFLQATNSGDSTLFLESSKQARYVIVDVPSALEQTPIKMKLHGLIRNGLTSKMIKPISMKCIDRNDVSEALQQSGEKVAVKMRDDHEEQLPCAPKFHCEPERVYVVVGGTGGIGLEFVDWLIERGAQHVVICSRGTPLTGYQQLKLNSWRTRSVNVHVSVKDVSSKQGSLELLEFANTLGRVDGIFNLAVSTKDDLFEQQTIESFAMPFAAKAYATEHLDQLSRKLCPELRHFVVLSSCGSAVGSATQTNYNMANSTMERICERRTIDGYPALAIQLGAVADVGMVTQMKNYNVNRIVAGSAPQNLHVYFEMLDQFIDGDECVVLCMSLASAASSTKEDFRQGLKNIIGIIDLKTISNHVTLPELGMDSVTSVEVQSYLATSHGLCLEMSEIRTLTMAKLDVLLNPTGTA